jgi:phosphoserine phosphatase
MNHHLLTCLGSSVNTTSIDEIKSLLSDEKVDILDVKTLSSAHIGCLEIKISSSSLLDTRVLTQKLLSSNSEWDVAIQFPDASIRSRKMIIFDMDSTLTEIEVIDELAKEAGVGSQVVPITARAMNGELSFKEALRERVALLRGLPLSALETVYKRMPFTAGAEKLIAVLKKHGYRTAVFSGGFDYFTSRVESTLGLDDTHANRLEISEGQLTGKVIGDIVDGQKKRSLMEEIALRESIPLNSVIAVGDGANDLPMIKRAGLGIAFCAKPSVRAAAPYNLTHRDLSLILHLLGLSNADIKAHYTT